MNTDPLFEILVHFASVVYFVAISGMHVCGWLHEVSAGDIVSAQLACGYTLLASSGQFGSWAWKLVAL